MSSTPKGPSPEDAAGQEASAAPRSALDQTFLGVAPAKPGPVPAAAARTASPGAPSLAASSVVAPPVTSPSPVALGSAALGSAALGSAARGSAIIAAPVISVQGARSAVPLPTSPRAANPDETPAHGTPRELVMPAAAGAPLQPQRTLAPKAPASPGGFEARAPLAPQVPPRVELGQQRTALASEYLRAAREAALAAQAVPQNRESAAAGRGWSAYETRAPGWSETSDAHARAVHESAPSRDDFGTQASVAPPFPDQGREERGPAVQPSFALAPPAPLPAPPPIGSMAASLPLPGAAHQRSGPPPLGRTLLEPTGGSAAHDDRPSSAPFGRASFPPGTAAFEHVPMPRGSLSDQSALQIPIDQSSIWDQPGVGHDSTERSIGQARSSVRTRRLLLAALATLAVAAIGFVTFGDRLTGSTQREQALLPRVAAPSAAPSLPLEAPPSVDTKASAPRAISSTSESLLPAHGATAGHALPTTASVKRSPLPRSEQDTAEDEAAAASTARAAEALASPEDKLAAEAARQVIASRYPEALPMYRELARKFPQNSAYGAMAHILEQKVTAAASNGAPGNVPGANP